MINERFTIGTRFTIRELKEVIKDLHPDMQIDLYTKLKIKDIEDEEKK